MNTRIKKAFQSLLAQEGSVSWVLPVVVGIFLVIVVGSVSTAEDFFGPYRSMVLDIDKYRGGNVIYSPAWLAPILAPFITLPGRSGYYALTAVTIGLLVYSSRVLGGKWLPVLFSAQLVWILWYGQIEGIVIFGITLCVLALKRNEWGWLAVGLLLALTKPQVGLAPAIYLWWRSGNMRWKSAAVIAGVFIGTLAAWGPWPLWILNETGHLLDNGAYHIFNVSLGLYALPLLIPAIALPLKPQSRLLALSATALLISPYLPYYSTILLLVQPIPAWLYVFAFYSYLSPYIGAVWGMKPVILLPLLTLAYLYYPFARDWVKKRLGSRKQTTVEEKSPAPESKIKVNNQ